MTSVAALSKAGQDVLRHHSRRVYVRQTFAQMGKGSQWAFFVSTVIAGIGVALARVSVPLSVLLLLPMPVCYIVLSIQYLLVHGNDPTPKQAAEAVLKYNQAIHLLTHSTDLESVGPLIEILWLPDITAYVPQALCRLLPQLQSDHAALLDSKQRNSLVYLLTQPDSHDPALRRATVKALGNIGDAKALPVLEQMAGGALGAADSPELREDARIALYELQERINPGYVGRNLLRASGAPTTSPDVLLRPATGSGETPPQELLRAQNGP